ncbi:hypothetical protein ACSMXN_05770 [Jatrophihabitans sp. DSM 45814]
MDGNSQFSQEVSRLRAIVEQNGDARLSALLVAVSDETVSELLVRRAGEGHEYGGALISNRGDLVDVVFTFSRKAGVFGILPLSILVRVNRSEQSVTELVDGYLPPPPPDPTQVQADLEIRAADFEEEGFGDEQITAEDEDGDGADAAPKVAPPPKKSLWI